MSITGIILMSIINIILLGIGLIAFACVLSAIIDVILVVLTGFSMIGQPKKEKEMKLWGKRKLTATNDLVDFILMKLYEEPDKWNCVKSGGYKWWKYQDTDIYVRGRLVSFNRVFGVVYHFDREIKLSKRQCKKIAAATTNIRAAKALRELMKATVKNAT